MSSSRLKFFVIAGILAFVLIGGFIIWQIPRTPHEITLEIWGVFDDSDQYAPLINKFNKTYPWVKINYKKLTYEEYERALLEAWALGKGPDIFLIHNTWLPKYQSHAYPLPYDKRNPLTAQDYRKTFMPVASYDFVRGDKIYAMPLFIDTLALYYNEGIFEEMYLNNPDEKWILTPPKTWDDLIKTVNYVAKKDEWGNIERAGIAMGTSNNINRASDILSLIMLQSGTKMISDNLKSAIFDRSTIVNGVSYNPGERSLNFYTDFANPRKKVYTWNIKRDYSIDDFSEGDVAMMIGYSHLIDTIKKKNPNLKFKVVPIPQIKESLAPVNYANYWAPAVSVSSEHKKEAWDFIRFASAPENVWLYLWRTNRPTARPDMISYQEKEMPQLKAFARQGVTAQSWYQIDNNAIEKIFLEMIEKVNYNRASASRAINEAAKKVTSLKGMTPPSPPPGPLKPPPGIGL